LNLGGSVVPFPYMAGIGDFLSGLLGLGVQPKDLSTLHVVSRTVLILGYSLVLVKVAHKRFMSRKTAFDFVVAFVLASILSRAINGSAPLVPTLVAGIVIVVIHWGLDYCSQRWRSVECFLKGESTLLVKNGEMDRQAMEAHHISEEDIKEDMRLSASTNDLEKVREARLERNGSISFVVE
jgi:uncharacterized membrane protein YcaP (DUF421 family)